MISRKKFSPKTFPIVCLCGSAGALQAYEAILRNLPVNMGMAFVLVAHRSPDDRGLLLKLLATMTDMEVVEATDEIKLKPNLLIVAPPRVEITTDGILLSVVSRTEPPSWPIMITTFLRSMAATCGPRSIAIILSGMGHDGSEALGAIKESGGATLAQSDGEWESMPQEAIRTGHVDFTLTAGEIAQHLGNIEV